jgi:hypothetical protein
MKKNKILIMIMMQIKQGIFKDNSLVNRNKLRRIKSRLNSIALIINWRTLILKRVSNNKKTANSIQIAQT